MAAKKINEKLNGDIESRRAVCIGPPRVECGHWVSMYTIRGLTMEVIAMFRNASGYKSQCGSLALFVASDFDEWRVLVQGPGTIIPGGREFSEDKAKAQALRIADEYLTENGEESSPAQADWIALEPGEWLNWRG